MSEPAPLRFQKDIAARLAAAPFFADIGIVQAREGFTDNDIAEALGPMKAGGVAGALKGLLVLILPPTGAPVDKQSVAASEKFELVARVLELPKLTKNARTHNEEIAETIKTLCVLAQLGPAPIIFEGREPYNDGEGTVGTDVKLSLTVAAKPAPRVANPQITGTADAVSISCSTPGAVVRFTLSGDYPTPAKLAFSTPFDATNKTVRACAYVNGKDASGVVEKSF